VGEIQEDEGYVIGVINRGFLDLKHKQRIFEANYKTRLFY